MTIGGGVPSGLDDVQARLALRDLIETYAAAVDARDAELFASLWADGAGQRIFYPDGQTVQRRAPDDLPVIATLSRRWEQTFHLVGNHRVIVDGSRATGQAYCLAHHIRGGRGSIIEHVMRIRYEDEYVNAANGWQFWQRNVHILWSRDLPVQMVGPELPWFEGPAQVDPPA